MNNNEAIKCINKYHKGLIYEVIAKYCIYKNKPLDSIQLFIQVLQLMPTTAIELAEIAITDISNDFNIISIYDKNNNYLKSYINKKQNGKEIQQI